MIETAIHVLIGFLAAVLLAMMAMPAISRRAFKLAENRAKLLAPLSFSQWQAELDALRGRHAIELLKAERRVDVAEGAAGLAEIELGRRARDIADRDARLQEKSLEIRQQRAEIGDLLDEARLREAEIGAREVALLDLTRQRDASAQRWGDAQALIEEQQSEIERKASEVALLRARLSESARELTELERAFESARAEAAARIASLSDNLVGSRALASRLESQFFDLEARHVALRNEAEGRSAELQRLRQRVAELEPQLSESDKIRSDLAVESTRQTTRATEKETELIRLRASQREEIERFQDRMGGAAARENELSMRIQALIAARVEAEGTLRTASSERDRLAKELAGFRERLHAIETAASLLSRGDASLRRAISRLGAEMVERRPDDRAGSESSAPVARRLQIMAASALDGEDERQTSLTAPF